MSEYDALVKAKLILSESLYIEEKFDLLIENYLEYEQFTLKSASEIMLFPNQKNAWFHSKKNTFNRLLINFLATSRLFLDHVPHHFKNMFEEKDIFVAKIIPFISEQYDNFFGYRLFEEMRNYMQHRSYPINQISIHSKAHELDNEREFSTTFSAFIDPERLDEKKFKKSILNELKGFGKRIDIKGYMRDYVTCLGKINNKVREEIKDVKENSDTLYNKTIESFNKKFGKNHDILLATNDDTLNYKSILLIPEIIKHRKYYERKNKDFSFLKSQYVTNKLHK